MDSDSILLLCIFVCIILFVGEPDIADGLIYWLSDGTLGATE